MKLSKEEISEIRSYAFRFGHGRGYSGAPIIIKEGKSKPEWAGRSYRYETKGGKRVYHPNAYKKVGWSNLRYYPSDRHIVVGKEWVKQLKLDLIQLKLSKQRGRLVARELAELYLILE